MEEIFVNSEATGAEQELIELILKYRDAVQKEQYLPIFQRETDRKRLNEIYQTLQSIRHKILDSRCYLELGKLQRQLSNKFLADATSPQQRIQMLAYLVRSLCYPVVFIAGRNTLIAQNSERDDNPVELSNEEVAEQSAQKSLQFRTHDISQLELEEIQTQIRQILKQCPDWKEWRQMLSPSQAEILSQMAANGEIEIIVEGDAPSQDSVTSVVIKEFAHDQ